MTVEATADDGTTRTFEVLARIDAPAEVDYLRHGGILPMVLNQARLNTEQHFGQRTGSSKKALTSIAKAFLIALI